MSPELGVLLVFIAFICSLYATVASFIAARRQNYALAESARNATIVIFPLLTVACGLMIGYLVAGNYEIDFVWSVTDRTLPTILRITALWGGQAGSLLFWTWILSGFAAGALLRDWHTERHLLGDTTTALAGTTLFFLILVAFWENPFATFWQNAEGDVVSALFAPTPWLSDISTAFVAFAAGLPGIMGVVGEGVIPFAAPTGYFSLTPADGQGLEPLLRHIGMIIHPPMLYLGFVGFTVPFAFAVAALAQGDTSDAWIQTTRRWTLVAWLFLSLGLILGGRWAYDVIGWGGYWGWDPVENASLMPWLTGTAFLHSVMIQEKRGMLRRWNVILIMLTYAQVIMGTFLTRSGLLSSVHSFAQSAIGPLFFIFVAIILIVCVHLLMKQWDALKSDNELDGLLSRETMFLLNNLVFVGINIAVAAGTYAPLFTELAADFIPGVEKSSYGPEFYERTTGPLFLVLLFLMGVAPLVAWKRASLKRLGMSMLYPIGFTIIATGLLFSVGVRLPGALIGYALVLLTASITLFEYYRGVAARVKAHGENYVTALWRMVARNRRRYGGYLIHLGVLVMGIGIISNGAYQLETQQTISAGQTITLGDYVVEYQGLERFAAIDSRMVARANTNVYRNGREVDQLTPRIDIYDTGRTMTIPDTFGTIRGDDLYVRLIDWEQVNLTSATFKIYYNPLIRWVWTGGFVFIFGTIVAALPDAREARRERTVKMQQRAAAPVAGD